MGLSTVSLSLFRKFTESSACPLRSYLPPPILDILNNRRLEAAKRAAIITTALKWLLDHVPLTVIPPQFRPGLMIAQRLVPYLGYVGGFLAWSWGAVKSFDKGRKFVSWSSSPRLSRLQIVSRIWRCAHSDLASSGRTRARHLGTR